MARARNRNRPNGGRTREQELIALARQAYGPALEAVVLGNLAWAQRFIAHLAHRAGLASADVEDAQQNALFWLVEALAHYGRRRAADSPGSAFRTFAHLVISDRFYDFVRALGRAERIYDDSQDVFTLLAALERSQQAGLPHAFLLACAKDDPQIAAERHEAEEKVRSALTELGDRERRYCRDLAEGTTLRETAAELDVSYVTAKRQRRSILQKLRVVLRQFASS